jgi:hypothetical protein
MVAPSTEVPWSLLSGTAAGHTQSRAEPGSHARESTNAGLDARVATHLLVAICRFGDVAARYCSASRAATDQPLPLQACRSHGRARSAMVDETCLRYCTGISSATTRALLCAEGRTVVLRRRRPTDQGPARGESQDRKLTPPRVLLFGLRAASGVADRNSQRWGCGRRCSSSQREGSGPDRDAACTRRRHPWVEPRNGCRCRPGASADQERDARAE